MISREQVDRAVNTGIITEQQRDALLALGQTPAGGEARRGLNAVNVAYWAGGIAVLVAFGWFLIVRWSMLGAAGVLVVSLVYAALFAWTARLLAGHGFRTAAGVATVLVIGIVPLVTWSLLSLTGIWDWTPPSQPQWFALPYSHDWENVRWLPIDLTTLLAGLVALRRVRFDVLGLPLAAAAMATGAHAFSLVFDQNVANALNGRLPLLLALSLLTIGYAVDRRTAADEDYATWFYLAGLVALLPAMAGFWRESKVIAAHAMLAMSALFVVAALRLRRRLFLAAAFVGFLSYLGYLTFNVFDRAASYPIVLATLGLATIIMTVWVQRRFPGLTKQLDIGQRQAIPGAPMALAGSLLIALVLTLSGLPAARQTVLDRQEWARFERLRIHNIRKLNAVRQQAGLKPASITGPPNRQTR